MEYSSTVAELVEALALQAGDPLLFTESMTFPIEGTDLVMRGIDAPPGFCECEDDRERDETIKKNMRGMLQLFNIKVRVFSGRADIVGAIPTQALDIPAHNQARTAPVISSPSLR